MDLFEIIGVNIQVLNTQNLIDSLIRSSLVVTLGLIAMFILYRVLPQRINELSTEDLISLEDRKNLPILIGIIGFFILGTTGYAFALSIMFNMIYTRIVSAWVYISFICLTIICISFLKKITLGLIPIVIGWTAAILGLGSMILGLSNPILEFIVELLTLSFLPSFAAWYLQLELPNPAQKIILIFNLVLLFYGIVKLLYFLFYMSGINFIILEFLYNISPTILDVICIFGPIALCFTKCQNDYS